MWVRASGQLSEHVFQLTSAVSSHLLVLGAHSALIDAGVSAISERLCEEIATFLPNDKTLDYLFITHGHFDHLSGIPQLRRAFPAMRVVASLETVELFEKEAWKDTWWAQNARCSAAMQVADEIEQDEWKKLLTVDQIVRDGDVFALGNSLGNDVELKVVSCPGHTDDCHAYVVRPDGALACGEALGGFHGRGKISSCFMSSYYDAQESFEKLATLEVNLIGLPHGGALTGELARTFIMLGRQAAQQFHDSVKQALAGGELVDEICKRLIPDILEQGLVAEGPFREMVEESVKKMVSVIAAEG